MPSSRQSVPSANTLRQISTLIGAQQTREVQIHSSLSVVPGLGLTEPAASLLERAERIENKTLRVAVVGSMGRGKSTLINAILGEHLLPIGNTATTGIITHIVDGTSKEVLLVEKDGNKTHLSREAFKHQYVLTSNDEIPQAFVNIDYAVIESDTSQLCKAGLHLVDTLGFNTTTLATQITENYLTHVDAVVLVLNAFALFDDTDVAILDAIKHIRDVKRNRVLLVINARTLDADKHTQIMESVQSILKHRFDAQDFDRICVVNAEAAADIRCGGEKTDTLDITGLPALLEELTQLLKGPERIDTILDATVCDVLIPTLASLRSHLQRHTDSQTQFDANETELTALQHEVDAIKAAFGNFTTEISNTLADHLITGLMQCLDTSKPNWQALDLKPGSLKLLTSQFGSGKRHQLAFEIVGKLTKYFQEDITDVTNTTLKGLQPQIRTTIETLEEKIDTFTRKLNAVEIELTPSELHRNFDALREENISPLSTEGLHLHRDRISGFLSKDTRLLTAALTTCGVAGLIPFLPFTDLILRLLFAGSLLCLDALLFWILSNKRNVETQIRQALNHRLKEKRNSLKTEIQELLSENSKGLFENLQTALKTEIQHRQRQLDTALAEKERLESIHTYFTEAFDAICQAVYGRRIPPEKTTPLVETVNSRKRLL